MGKREGTRGGKRERERERERPLLNIFQIFPDFSGLIGTLDGGVSLCCCVQNGAPLQAPNGSTARSAGTGAMYSHDGSDSVSTAPPAYTAATGSVESTPLIDKPGVFVTWA